MYCELKLSILRTDGARRIGLANWRIRMSMNVYCENFVTTAGAEVINHPFVFAESRGMPGIDHLVTNRISWHFSWLLFSERVVFTTIRERRGSVSGWISICKGNTPIDNAIIQSTLPVPEKATQLLNSGWSNRPYPVDKLVRAERVGADER